MSAKDAHLYGQRPKSRSVAKEISSSSTLAFTSQLSSLIASSASASATNKPTSARARPKKEDIFSTHNKNVRKRAAKDMGASDFTTQKHSQRTGAEKATDDSEWRRRKRKLDEKARLYDALKRGDIEDLDDKYGVDFDRKWAEAQEHGEAQEPERSESDSHGSDSEPEELFDYVDEFGRTRKMSRIQIAIEERRKRTEEANTDDRFTAKPTAPEHIIYGDAIQTHAFNPDETRRKAMEELAKKRDRSLTPPPAEHFDGRKEARLKGTAFYNFSKDEEERKRQMESLEKEREETKRKQAERKDRVEQRRREVEERKKAIREKRAQGKANRFLDELGGELFGEKGGSE